MYGNEKTAQGGLSQQSQTFNVGKPERPDGELQSLSMENADRCKSVNRQLAVIRGKLFGECEISKDAPAPNNVPMPSVQASLHCANEELLEISRQLDSIINRL